MDGAQSGCGLVRESEPLAMTQHADDYRWARQSIRLRRIWLWSGILAVPIAVFWPHSSRHSDAVGLLWFAWTALAGLSVRGFKCPRCGHRFHFLRRWFWVPFAKSCRNCGLEL